MYWIISEIVDRINEFARTQDRQLDSLRRQMVEFVAAVQNGSLEPELLKRLRDAAYGRWPSHGLAETALPTIGHLSVALRGFGVMVSNSRIARHVRTVATKDVSMLPMASVRSRSRQAHKLPVQHRC